jgi:hypothetical protein
MTDLSRRFFLSPFRGLGHQFLFMFKKTPNLLKITLAIALPFIVFQNSFCQIEIEPWGNIKGIRIKGQLMEFESNLSVVNKDWSNIKATGRERQRPKYIRSGNQQIVSTNIDSLYFIQTVEDAGKGSATVNVQLTSKGDESLEGVFFSLSLPREYFSNGTVRLDDLKAVKIAGPETTLNKYLQTPARSVQFISPKRQLKIIFKETVSIIVKTSEDKNNKGIQIFIPIQTGDVQKGQIVAKTFSIEVSGLIDKSPVNLTLNTAITGRVFDGLGGNFRLQNSKTDPQVIDYCLNNLNVTWGRAEMPWKFWQPAVDSNPIAAAKSGKLNLQVQKSMEMAQRLFKMGMPVILSAWSAPDWAIVGKHKSRPGPDGVWGNPLDATKANEVYQSIADYIVYLKEEYGVEISMFSFNESDLGINIRQTGEEHAALIKGLGAYFVSRGLKTKMLLGDNSDANSYKFIYPAMADAETYQYIGAISFHSWRGTEKETLEKWADAATKLNKPLIVGEGGIDATAWNYPAIFEEQIYAMEEIDLYTRILAICQPASILQWQLTADYSPLAGGGIFGDNGPLRPTQRFWNLKQLSSTPKGLKAMPLHSDAVNVSSAALGDNGKGIYAIHLVNNGNTRQVNLRGLPKKVKLLKVFITDKKRSMKEGKSIPVLNGKARFMLDETSYTTLISE